MFTEDERAFLARATRTMQIIVGALAAGVISFFVVVLLIDSRGGAPPPEMPVLTYMALATAPAAILVATFFPGVVLRSQRQAILDGKSNFAAAGARGNTTTPAEGRLMPLLGGYQTALIIRSAILEGAAFFALVAYMVEGKWWSLAAAGVLLLFLLTGMPTLSRVADAVEHERRAIEEMRQMRSIDAR
jgi:hypothetical protein